MTTHTRKFVLLLALGLTAGGAWAAGDDHHHNRHHSDDWEQREAQRHREQAQWERDQEWQRQQREELRRRAEWQRHRDEAWQRQQEAELRRRAAHQRRGPGHHHDYDDGYHWERGHHYDGAHHVVYDYGHHHLRRPPRGHHWVRADNNYLLVTIATGLIMDIAAR